MKFLIKKIYITLFFFTILLTETHVFSKDSKIQYKSENLSNYFSGIISLSRDHDEEAYQYLNKVELLKKKHSEFNVKYIRSLVMTKKFKEAFAFSKSVWSEDEMFFETDLLLGLDYFIKKDYVNAEKHFERLNELSRYNLLFNDFFGNTLIAWTKATQNKKNESFQFLEKIPPPYENLKKTQKIFLNCYFDSYETNKSFRELINDQEYNFSRYNFFLINYLLFKNKPLEAKKILEDSLEEYNSNLLLKQTQDFLTNDKEKIKRIFNCENPKDSIAEFFYLIANLYSSEREYQLSNFYLQISLFLNNKFLPNKALLAENFYYQKKQKLSKNLYKSLKKIGQIYSWYASKNIAAILVDEKGEEYSVKYLEKEFKLLKNINFEHYYDLANFFKENGFYEESIKYYTLALDNIGENNPLIAKILDRRGTSFERSGNWEEAEKDLMASLLISPNQPHVLNYLAYTWVEMGINLDEALEMLETANELRENDGYIIDSLGWAHYAKKDYNKAKFFLEKAVELFPSEPVINDHLADTLWMLNKNIQARYIWNYVLQLEDTEQELKDLIKKKLIFGVTKKI